ncbi:MAG: RHS repeat-associated core domain-containing protein, partial [Acidovorax sp.]|nr:RHS repeat-associated core domain-containing protein [Acidovorax sp.]
RTQAFYSTITPAGTATLQRSVQTTSGTNRISGYSQAFKPAGSTTSQNSTVSYLLDASGALTKKGDNHLHQSAQGRIAKVSLSADASAAQAVSYVYNAMAQRLLKSDARLSTSTPVTEQAVYADDGVGSTVLGLYGNRRSSTSAAPAAEMDSTEVIYLPTASGPMPVAALVNGRMYAIDADHLNTPRRLTNTQGQVAWQWLITGFGEVQPTHGATGYALDGIDNGKVYSERLAFNLRYPGQQWDPETQLSYNLNRYFDPQTGRYVQSDPIGLDGGWNRFGYVGGNPLNGIDPQGLNFITFGVNLAMRGYGAAQAALYRYAPTLTELVAGASGVNGAVVSPMSPLVNPPNLSQSTPCKPYADAASHGA